MSTSVSTSRLARRLRWAASIVVVCAFAVVIVMLVRGFWSGAGKIGPAQMKIKEIVKACDRYLIDHGEYPPDLSTLLQEDQNGKGPYLAKESLIDPWGKPFLYAVGGSHHVDGVAAELPNIYCVSPDGKQVFAR